MMPHVPLEPRIVGRPDGTYQVVYDGRVLASCDSYMEAADWIEERRAAMLKARLSKATAA